MKKLISIILLCLLLAACAPFSAASSDSSTASTVSEPEKSDSSELSSVSPSSSKKLPVLDPVKNFDVMQTYLGYGKPVTTDGDTLYMTSFDRIARRDPDGQITILTEDFMNIKAVAVHGNYIYFLERYKIHRMSKDGGAVFDYQTNYDMIESLCVKDDWLLIHVVKKDYSSAYCLCANISADPDELEFIPCEEEFNFDESNRKLSDTVHASAHDWQEKHKFHELLCTYITDRYIYFRQGSGLKDDESYWKQVNRETEEVVDIPLDIRKRVHMSVIDGWIYYWNSDFVLCRSTEDFTRTEKLLESNQKGYPNPRLSSKNTADSSISDSTTGLLK